MFEWQKVWTQSFSRIHFFFDFLTCLADLYLSIIWSFCLQEFFRFSHLQVELVWEFDNRCWKSNWRAADFSRVQYIDQKSLFHLMCKTWRSIQKSCADRMWSILEQTRSPRPLKQFFYIIQHNYHLLKRGNNSPPVKNGHKRRFVVLFRVQTSPNIHKFIKILSRKKPAEGFYRSIDFRKVSATETKHDKTPSWLTELLELDTNHTNLKRDFNQFFFRFDFQKNWDSLYIMWKLLQSNIFRSSK